MHVYLLSSSRELEYDHEVSGSYCAVYISRPLSVSHSIILIPSLHRPTTININTPTSKLLWPFSYSSENPNQPVFRERNLRLPRYRPKHRLVRRMTHCQSSTYGEIKETRLDLSSKLPIQRSWLYRLSSFVVQMWTSGVLSFYNSYEVY